MNTEINSSEFNSIFYLGLFTSEIKRIDGACGCGDGFCNFVNFFQSVIAKLKNFLKKMFLFLPENRNVIKYNLPNIT